MKKINWRFFITTIRWEFVLDGENKVLEVKINDYTGKISFILNSCIHYTASITPFSNWGSIPFGIGEHICNFIYTSGTPLNHNDIRDYNLIIDGRSIYSGELYDLSQEKKKYLKKFYTEYLRITIGVIIGSYLSGYMLATMTEGLMKFSLRILIFLIGCNIGTSFFDIIAYIFRWVRKNI